MLYINQSDIDKLKESWKDYAEIISDATIVHSQGDFNQPIKPYLRFKKPINRIIAMPAYLGGKFDISGIKWIASFPDNLTKQLPRAHSLIILNDTSTGIPLAVLESGLISGIRTAAVSASLITKYINLDKKNEYTVGISGYGPIAKLHIEMLNELLGTKIKCINVYDINLSDNENRTIPNLNFCASWEEAYNPADIFITCTSSNKSYINKLPKLGSLQLNVSLRDYNPEIVKQSSQIIVDDWAEICRENTDIENTHLTHGLQKKDTVSLSEFLRNNNLDPSTWSSGFLSFHPMGLAIFDMAIAHRFYNLAKKNKFGSVLSNDSPHLGHLCSQHVN